MWHVPPCAFFCPPPSSTGHTLETIDSPAGALTLYLALQALLQAVQVLGTVNSLRLPPGHAPAGHAYAVPHAVAHAPKDAEMLEHDSRALIMPARHGNSSAYSCEDAFVTYARDCNGLNVAVVSYAYCLCLYIAVGFLQLSENYQ